MGARILNRRPAVNPQTLIAFGYDKHGRPAAYRVSMRQMRYFRIPLEEAKLLLATEQAREVPYQPFSRGLAEGPQVLNRGRRRNQSLFDEPGGLDHSQIHAAGIAAAERFGARYGDRRFEEWWKSEGRERSNLTQSDARRAFLEGFEEVEGPTVAAELDQWDIRQEGARRAEAAEADLWGKADRQKWGEHHFNVWWNSGGKNLSSLGPILSKENFLRGWMATYEPTDNRGRRRNVEDPNESVQDRSYREWRENFNRVSADPEAASNKDLSRAIGFLDQMRRHVIRRAQEEGRKVDANVLAGYNNEQDYYISIIRRREQRRAS